MAAARRLIARFHTGLEQAQSELPDTNAWFSRRLSGLLAQYLVCLIFALLLRAATFGDPAVHIDEAFYFLVGHLLNDGALLYVDVWDRKPPLIFLLYAGFAAVSSSPVSYQIGALIFATTTAFLIIRIARHWAGVQGSVLAGIAYLALLNTFEGIGGQTPVFYNLPVAFAAWSVVTSIERLGQGEVPRRIYAGMFACGLAIMTKQTALFESVAFGLYCTYLLWRSGSVPWLKVAILALLGALPTLAIAGFYFQIGHWFEFWHAMVTSNLEKQGATVFQYSSRLVRSLSKVWFIALLLFVSIGRVPERTKPFALLWLASALLGYLSVPNFHGHYFLPLAVPLAAIVALELDRRFFGAVWLGLLLLTAAISSEFYNIRKYQASRANMHALSEMVNDQASLLVFDGPPSLYYLADKKPLSPLVFPNHFNHATERDVSYLSSSAELTRLLSDAPESIAIAREPRVILSDHDNLYRVRKYIEENCILLGYASASDLNGNHTIEIYGNCSLGIQKRK